MRTALMYALLVFVALSSASSAQSVLLNTSLNDNLSVAFPAAGTGTGALINTTPASDFVAGYASNGIRLDATGDFVRYQQTDGSTQNVELDKGTVEMWFKSNTAYTDGVRRTIFSIGGFGTGASGLHLEKEPNSDLVLRFFNISGAIKNTIVPGTVYSWSAGQWINIRVTWDFSVAAGVQNIRIYLNSTEANYSTITTGPEIMPAEMASRHVAIGNRGGSGQANTWANGVVDEFVVWDSPLPPAATDTTPPVRSNGQPSGTFPSGTSSTTISLTTNEAATCKYSTTSGVAYAAMANTFSATGGFSHSTLVTGLSDGQSYNYYVRCIDGAGNANTNDYLISFSVASAADTTPPAVSITSPSNSSTVSGSITVSASANDNVAVARVELYKDFALLGNDSAAPYQFAWDTTLDTNGFHTIQARAVDTSANANVDTIFVNVNNAAPVTLAAAYGFEEASGTATADSSGSGNGATLVNGTSWAAGRYGGALLFDGTNDHVSVPHSNSLNITGGLTIEAWVKPAPASLSGGIIEKTVGGIVNRQYLLFVEGGLGKLRIIKGGTSSTVQSNSALPVNQWTHLAGTWDGSTMRLYVNGVLQASTASVAAPIDQGNGVTLIGMLGSGLYKFNGTIDEIRVYNGALSQAQVALDMNTPIGPADTAAPVVSNLTANAGQTTAAITWDANEPTNGTVRYGLTQAAMNSRASSPAFALSGIINLSSLSASTLYFYQFTGCDVSGNCNISATKNFTTTAVPDTTAPPLNPVSATSITSNSSTIVWSTNESSTSVVNYSTSPFLGTIVSDPSFVMSHSVQLTPLLSSTIYYYNVRSCDASGNCNTSSVGNFTTAATLPTQCADGTALNACSVNKPLFCTGAGALVSSCTTCGCPASQQCNATTGACFFPNATAGSTCVDGTPFNLCSTKKPYFCEATGNRVAKCSACGCPGGYSCSSATGTCAPSGPINYNTLTFSGSLKRNDQAQVPCFPCTVTVALGVASNSANTNANGDFNVAVGTPSTPGSYLFTVTINDFSNIHTLTVRKQVD